MLRVHWYYRYSLAYETFPALLFALRQSWLCNRSFCVQVTPWALLPLTFVCLDTKKRLQKKSQGKPDPSGRFALLARSVCFFFNSFFPPSNVLRPGRRQGPCVFTNYGMALLTATIKIDISWTRCLSQRVWNSMVFEDLICVLPIARIFNNTFRSILWFTFASNTLSKSGRPRITH